MRTGLPAPHGGGNERAALHDRNPAPGGVAARAAPARPCGRRAELRSPTCGSRSGIAVQLDRTAGSSASRSRSHACAFGQARQRCSAASAVGRRATRSPSALDELDRLASGERDDPGGWPGLDALAPARSRKSRHGAILLPFRALARRDRGRARMTRSRAAAGDHQRSLLESGAIMLGAALVFVTVFRKLGLGATLGYIVGGALIGPQVLGLIGDPEQLDRACPKSASRCCCSSSGWSCSRAGCGGCARTSSGSGWSQVVLCGARAAACSSISRSASARGERWRSACRWPCRRPRRCCRCCASTDELNTPQGERAFSILLFQDLSIVPMITIIAAMSRAPADPSAPSGWMLALYTVGAIVGLVARRPLRAQSLVPADRPARRARAVRRRRPVRGHRQRGADAHRCTCRSRSARSSPA